MMQEKPFPFWTSRQTITYTDLQIFCRGKYERRGHILIEEMRKSLEAYRDAQDKIESFEALSTLNDVSLDISCFNVAWIDFSNATFEALVMPTKTSKNWLYNYLNSMFEATLRRPEWTLYRMR
jgi:hypothetical protein